MGNLEASVRKRISEQGVSCGNDKERQAFGNAARRKLCANRSEQKTNGAEGQISEAENRLQFPGPEEEPALVTTKSRVAINSTERNSMQK
jgi:hypothetical protein